MTPAEQSRQSAALRRSLNSELIELGRQFDEISPCLSSAYERNYELEEECGGYVAEPPEVVLLSKEMDPLLEKISATRAITMAGLKIKARAALWAYGLGLDPLHPADAENEDQSRRMAWSVLRDLVG